MKAYLPIENAMFQCGSATSQWPNKAFPGERLARARISFILRAPEAVPLHTCDDVNWEHDVPFEPAGSEPLALGSVTKCLLLAHIRQESSCDGLD